MNSEMDVRSKRYSNALEGLLLALIILLAIFMAYIPHLDYAYPLHIDEWYSSIIASPITSTFIFLRLSRLSIICEAE